MVDADNEANVADDNVVAFAADAADPPEVDEFDVVRPRFVLRIRKLILVN